MGFLSFILFIILGFYLLGIIARWFLRSWIIRKQREFSENFGGAYTNSKSYNNQQESAKEGEVRVKKQADAPKRVSKDVGEYVEYVEYKESEENLDSEK